MNAQLTTDRNDVAINGDLTRHRALLKVSGTVGTQPTFDAVLHSLATLLSNVVSFESIALLLIDPSGQRLALRALDRSHDDAAILHFPASRGFMSDIPLHVAREDLERLRARPPKPLTASDKMPPLRQSVPEFHLTSHSNIEPSLPAHFLEYRRSEHGMSLARGGAD